MKLADLECKVACGDLVTQFGNHIDYSQYEQVVALFATDGVVERGEELVLGHEEILATLRKRPKDRITRHIVSNIHIVPTSETTATGRSYVFLFRTTGDVREFPLPLPAPVACAEWHNEFRRTSEGWRISRHKIVIALGSAP